MFRLSHAKVILLQAALCAVSLHAELVGYWNFDEGSGTNAMDASTHHNHGTLLAIGGGQLPVWDAGRSGEPGDFCLSFAQGQVVVPDHHSLHISNAFTVAAWMLDIGSNYGHLFVAGDGGPNDRNWLLQTSAFGGDAAYFWSATIGNFQRRLDFIPPMGAWHHMAVTYDGRDLRAYLDGTLRSTKSTSAGVITAWGTLRLGGFSVFGSGFEGLLDDMVMFNTVEDVGSIMNRTHPEMHPGSDEFVLSPYANNGVVAETATGFLYTLQVAWDLRLLSWTNVAGQVDVAGTGSARIFADPSPDQPFRVYRLLRNPGP